MRIYFWYGATGEAVHLDRLDDAALGEAEQFVQLATCEFANGVTRAGVLEQIAIIRNVRARGGSFDKGERA